MIDTIRSAWAWTGLVPEDIVATNAFGNIIVRATDGTFWRICPEELSCEVVAKNRGEYQALLSNEEFLVDWEIERLVELARAKFAELPLDRCYCLKVPGTLGGNYQEQNLGTITREEAVAFSGDVAEQIKDLPDGATVKITVSRPGT